MTQKSQSPDDASKKTQLIQERLNEERRRFPRLALSREAFRLRPHGKLFSLSDLSPDGFCLRVTDDQDLLAFPVGAIFHGELGFRGERVRVEAQVRHVERGYVGAELVKLSDQDRETLNRRLNPEVLGSELRLIPGGDLEQLWFHALNGADWNLQLNAEGAVQGFLLRLHGGYIQWRGSAAQEGGDSLMTGRIGHSLPNDFESGAIRMETWSLHADSQPDAQKMRIAIQLLSGCKERPQLRDFCIGVIRARMPS